MTLRSLLAAGRAPVFILVLALLVFGCGDSGGNSTTGDDTSTTGDETSSEPGDETDGTGDETSSETGDETGDQTAWDGTVYDVVINEVAPAGSPNDWVELYNRGDVDADLSGWKLSDDDPEHILTLAEGTTLTAGQYLLLLRDEPGSFTFGYGGADGAFLYTPDGDVVDWTEWADDAAPTGFSWGRLPDGTGDFETLADPTPAAPNVDNPTTECGNDETEYDELCDGDDVGDATCETVGLATGTLTCNESCNGYELSGCDAPSQILTINEVRSVGDDAIELTNPGDDPVDLSGWWVTDENDQPTGGPWVFSDGTMLQPGEYLVLIKGQQHTFGLGGKDGVKLRNSDGELIDKVDWSGGDADVSYCRIPDGLGEWQACSASTFGAENVP